MHKINASEWPAAHVATLRDLWALGLTINEIARRLGVSRNAVIGKRRRLSLAARPSPIVRDKPPRPQRIPRGARHTLPPLPSLSGFQAAA